MSLSSAAKNWSMASHHRLMPPSASGRWLTCTASAKAVQDIVGTSSPFAAEGTLAHSMFEIMLNGEELPPAGTAFEVDGYALETSLEMYDHLQRAVEYTEVLTWADELKWTEHKVMLKSGITGTVDLLMAGGNMLEVMDLKYGQGERVEVENNTQLMIYALGALHQLGNLFDFEQVRLHILQPRLGHFVNWMVPLDDLLEWELDVLDPATHAIQNDIGRFVASETACRWCPLTGRCDAQHAHMASMFEELPPAVLPSDMEKLSFELVLPRAAEMRAYANAVEAAAFRYALQGMEIPGYKLVEGRSARSWAPGAETELVNTIQKPYESRLKSVAVVEKELGRTTFRSVGLDAWVTKPPGKPTLVKASDKRPAVQTIVAPSDFDEIENVE